MSFVDGYLVAAPSRALVLEAIAHRAAGTTLTASQAFRDRLPSDAETDFSALFWQNLGSVAGPLAELLGGAVAPSDREQIEAMAKEIGPMLVLAYGDADRVRFVTRGGAGPLGLSFEKLLALGGLLGSRFSTPANDGGPRRTKSKPRRARRLDGASGDDRSVGGRRLPPAKPKPARRRQRRVL